MSFRSLAIVLLALILLGEAGLALWRHAPIPVSTASDFSFPPAAANFGKSPNLAPDGTRLTVFYFEWDQINAGPKLEMVEHSPGERTHSPLPFANRPSILSGEDGCLAERSSTLYRGKGWICGSCRGLSGRNSPPFHR